MIFRQLQNSTAWNQLILQKLLDFPLDAKAGFICILLIGVTQPFGKVDECAIYKFCVVKSSNITEH